MKYLFVEEFYFYQRQEAYRQIQMLRDFRHLKIYQYKKRIYFALFMF